MGEVSEVFYLRGLRENNGGVRHACQARRQVPREDYNNFGYADPRASAPSSPKLHQWLYCTSLTEVTYLESPRLLPTRR